ncbi:MAG: xanthine dehydrogenase family protein molybdopterin-binding subunit [Alphaproteobacteria bacterium]|jgi:CO/xanthine dehydrogenase Mo-binding subunit|nr:xanthine dehydrogenase family protein molybdopterin-binding subunit [Alphaproteobacteria bacterium]MDP6588645.1 xanthine dehydrogenase family protein molybdopterin-binding subunit [Alphaproteobacteria bacterium]MDP6816974.1 xanthine dehydrogenase family protein molybdopterin-binding subunit [Alphaproteobacteria bacterium]
MSDIESAIGKSPPRLEAAEKAAGQALFSGDMVLPGMLHGALLTSPYAHARILSYDASAALAHPGVKAVVTAEDITGGAIGPLVRDEYALARGKTRYIGEPVAAVAAESEAIARLAARLVEVEYEELPAVATIAEAMAEGAPLLHEDFADYLKIYPAPENGGNLMTRGEAVMGRGTDGFDEADIVVEGVYEVGAQYHAYMEPVSVLAAFAPDGRVTVWSSTQSIFRVQANLHEGLGIPMTKIRCVAARVGGGFGGKAEVSGELVAVMLARKAAAPVRLVLSRDEDMTSMRARHPGTLRVKTGAKADGTLVAREVELWFDAGAYADDSPAVLSVSLQYARGPYNIPHVHVLGHAVYTNKLRFGAFRGFGNPQASFAGESQIDELAEKLGIDPIELRIKNAIKAGDRWLGGQTITSSALGDALRAVRAASDWTRPRAAPAGCKRGLGVSAVAHTCAFLSAGAIVRLQGDGTVIVNTGAVDIGQGSDTALSQMCAAALGLDIEQVSFATPDTDSAPYNYGTVASRVTYTVGHAVHEAAMAVRAQLFDHAAAMLECAPERLELRPGGRVGVSGEPARNAEVSFADIAGRSLYAVGGPITGSGSFMTSDPLDPEHTKTSGLLDLGVLSVRSFGAQAVEVEVDEATGAVRVVEAWCAHDAGRAVNPGAIESQIHGAFTQGMGYALTEELLWEDCRLVNPSFMDYKFPGAMEAPERINAIVLETPEVSHPLGVKGVAEQPLVAAAPAINNAVSAATGLRLKRIPLTPERVLNALLAKG